jgi:hypothetical protein
MVKPLCRASTNSLRSTIHASVMIIAPRQNHKKSMAPMCFREVGRALTRPPGPQRDAGVWIPLLFSLWLLPPEPSANPCVMGCRVPEYFVGSFCNRPNRQAGHEIQQNCKRAFRSRHEMRTSKEWNVYSAPETTG